MACGAYTITHLKTGLFYIGSTGDYKKRQCQHLYYMRKKRHSSIELQEAYSDDSRLMWNFIETTTKSEAKALEKVMISSQIGNPLLCNKHFNNYALPEIQRVRISEAKLGYQHKAETKLAMSSSRKGKPKNPLWIDKIVESRRKTVSVDGKTYISITEAAKDQGVSIQLAIHRFNSTRDKWSQWTYA